MAKVISIPENQLTDLTIKDRLKYKRIRVSGKIIEVKEFEKLNNDMPIERLNNLEYLVKSTGEIKSYKKMENRSDNMYEIIKSMGDARSIINANFDGGRNQIWITLTYKNQIRDHKQLYNDFRKFIKRLRYHVKRDIEYIMVAEPHQSGNWHLHGLLKANDGKNFYVSHEDFNDIWGLGNTDLKRLKNSDNVGAYISAYLQNTSEKDSNGKPNKKRERLKWYPPKMRFLRYSRGIVKPEWKPPNQIEKRILRAVKPEYLKGKEIIDDSGSRVQTIIYRQYNLNRR